MLARRLALAFGMLCCASGFVVPSGTTAARHTCLRRSAHERVGKARTCAARAVGSRHVGGARIFMSLLGLKLDEAVAGPFKADDRVRVAPGLAPLRHVPGHKAGFDACGSEGKVLPPTLLGCDPVRSRLQPYVIRGQGALPHPAPPRPSRH